jgi:hypothetical protein
VAALLVVVLLGATGLLGDTTQTTRVSGDGIDLTLTWATSSRAGMDVPWEVSVHRAGGFTGDITLAVTGSYFDIYETQGWRPDPSDSTREGDTLYLTFSKPPGDTLVAAYDAYIQPSSQVGRSGHLAVLDRGREAVSLDFRTILLP